MVKLLTVATSSTNADQALVNEPVNLLDEHRVPVLVLGSQAVHRGKRRYERAIGNCTIQSCLRTAVNVAPYGQGEMLTWLRSYNAAGASPASSARMNTLKQHTRGGKMKISPGSDNIE